MCTSNSNSSGQQHADERGHSTTTSSSTSSSRSRVVEAVAENGAGILTVLAIVVITSLVVIGPTIFLEVV